MTDRAIQQHRVTPTEWRLYITTGLAVLYLACWRAICGVAPALPPESSRTTAAPVPPRATLWLDELPAARRPPILLPAGWTVADRGAPGASSLRRLVHAPVSRPIRVRTRSS